ncbi:MAG TPA: hypothetical protein VED46_05720 [Alphaproteobacteria bacterium]|nr:hypothetical protein [Alphaproteobacteria bacterium]
MIAPVFARMDPRRGWVPLLLLPAAIGLLWSFSILVVGYPTGQLVSDSAHYIAIANGLGETVPRPFSNRVLHASIAGWIAGVIDIPVEQAFPVLAIVTIVSFAMGLAVLSRNSGTPLWLVSMFALSPWLAGASAAAFLPDLFHAALVAAFLLALSAQQTALGSALLVAAGLTREHTLLLGLVAAGWFALHGRSWPTAAMLIAAVATPLLLNALVSSPFANVHELNSSLYLTLKLAHSGLRNFFGLTVWSNTFDFCPDQSVSHIVPLPPWLRLGSIDRVGLCAIDWWRPFETLGVLLTIFGVAPLLMIHVWRSGTLPRKLPDAVAIAGIYGVFAFALGPFAGTYLSRLIGYGWPAFLVFGPWLLCRQHLGRNALPLVGVQLAVLWAPALSMLLAQRELRILTVLSVALIGYAGAAALLGRAQMAAFRSSPPSPDSSGSTGPAPP